MAQSTSIKHSSARKAAHSVKQVKSNWIPPLARIGYGAKGVVYSAVGIISVQAAMMSGDSKGTKGAIATIGEQPFGTALLWLIGLGLFAYVIWRFVQAGYDTEAKGSDAKGMAARTGMVISGLTYSALAFSAIAMAQGGGGGSGGSSKQAWTAEIMSMQGGRWIIGIVGLVIIGVGIFQFMKAAKCTFMKNYDRSMPAKSKKWARRLGRTGLSARGVTFLIIGGFVVQSAYTANPSEAKGLDAALSTLAAQPYGNYLLAFVALGLIAYGIYCFSRAKYRDFAVE